MQGGQETKDHFVEVDDVEPRRAVAGQFQEMFDELGASARGVANFRHVSGQLALVADLPSETVETVLNGIQAGLEIHGNFRHLPICDDDFSRIPNFALESFPLGDIGVETEPTTRFKMMVGRFDQPRVRPPVIVAAARGGVVALADPSVQTNWDGLTGSRSARLPATRPRIAHPDTNRLARWG